MYRTIGIDFGTSTTVLCYRDHEDGRSPSDAQFLHFEDHRPLLDSVAYDIPHGDTLFGMQARLAAEEYGDREGLARHFKMDLLSSESRAVAERRMRQLFAFLYQQYDAKRTVRIGDRVPERTWVSYPAKWPPPLQEATIKAAEDAGFTNVQGVDEPTAAMQFFLHHENSEMLALSRDGIIASDQPLTVLLIDLGAGTTDIVLYRTTPGRSDHCEILTTWPSVEGASFGGRDIDRLLSSDVTDYITRHVNPNVADQIETEAERWREIVDYKELQLSKKLAADAAIGFGYLQQHYVKKHRLRDNAPLYQMDRARFGEIAAEHLQTFVELVNGAVGHAVKERKIASTDEVDLAILTGGHSNWYFIKEILCGKWVAGLPGDAKSGSGVMLPKLAAEPRRCLNDPDPQKVVARGLTFDLPVLANKPAANSLWYELAVNFGSERDWQRRWSTLVVARDTVLPVQRHVFKRIDFDRPLSAPNDLSVALQLIPVVGEHLETGLRFTAHPLAGTIRPGRVVGDLLRKFIDKSTTTREHLDIYLEITVDRNERVSYRGLIDLDSANECWAFNHPRKPFAPGETEALRGELMRRRSGSERPMG